MNTIFESYQESINEKLSSNKPTTKLAGEIASLILKEGDSKAAHLLTKAVSHLHSTAMKYPDSKPSLLEVENFMQVLQDYKGK